MATENTSGKYGVKKEDFEKEQGKKRRETNMVKYSTVNLHTAHMIGGCHASLTTACRAIDAADWVAERTAFNVEMQVRKRGKGIF